MLLPGKYGVFLFVYIKRHVNKEAVSTCSLLGMNIAVHKQENLFVQKKVVLQKKCEDSTKSKNVGSHLSPQKYN